MRQYSNKFRSKKRILYNYKLVNQVVDFSKKIIKKTYKVTKIVSSFGTSQKKKSLFILSLLP